MTPPAETYKDWHKALLTADATLQQAIYCLNESSFQIAVVIHANGKLYGTLTDGDIRRGLLRGLTLESSIESLVKTDPFVVPPNLGRDAVLMLMQSNGIHQLPIVNEVREVVGLHALHKLLVPQKRGNFMVVMVGGQGTRLRPYTENCPKPLLPVGDKPMLEHIVERARAEGFSRFVFAVNYLGHMIEDYFGDGSKWDVEISYLRENEPLGTAGAIGLLENSPEDPFVVSNGDVLTDIRYGELLDFHNRYEAAATMAVRLHEWQHPFGVVRTNGMELIGFEEKPVVRNHINAGIYVLDPVILSYLQAGKRCDMPELFQKLQHHTLRTIVYPMHEPWLDVGRPDDLHVANSQKS